MFVLATNSWNEKEGNSYLKPGVLIYFSTSQTYHFLLLLGIEVLYILGLFSYNEIFYPLLLDCIVWKYCLEDVYWRCAWNLQVVSTLASPTSTATSPPSSTTTTGTVKEYRKVDYSTGKGSYDVTGKGGSKSEYYGQDWSKKTAFPKKVPSLTNRKYSHKY